MHHQKGVAVHLLIILGAHINGKPELAYSGIHVYGHGFRGRPGQARFVAGAPVAAAILAKAARIHEQQKSPLAAGQKDLALQFDQFGVDLARPGMAVSRLVHGAGKMHDNCIAVLAEKTFTFGYRRRIGRAGGGVAVFAAAELAFHAHPLGHDDFPGVDPFVVVVAFGFEYVVDNLPLFRSQTHVFSIPLDINLLVNMLVFL